MLDTQVLNIQVYIPGANPTTLEFTTTTPAMYVCRLERFSKYVEESIFHFKTQ
jgi:hypothetical protein